MNGRAYKETVKVTYLYKTLQNSCLDPDEPVPYSRSSILATQTFRRIAILVVQSYVRDASGEPRLHLHLLSIVAASISPSHDPGSTGVNEVLYHFHLRSALRSLGDKLPLRGFRNFLWWRISQVRKYFDLGEVTNMKRHRNVMWFVSFIAWRLLAVMFIASPVFAQTPTSSISGVVKDIQGGTIPGASVTVTNTGTGMVRTDTTGSDGAYRFPALNVGSYRVDATKEGFKTQQRSGITLNVAQSAAIDITLQVGSEAETVTVTAETSLVQTTSSTGGGLVNQQEISELPLNGRNLVDLTLMQPGISQTTVLPVLTQTSGMQGGVTMSANGAGPHSNNVFLDGANEINFWGLNGSSIIGTSLGVDGTQEYKVVTILPDAEYGLQMGAQTVIVSKGGTNNWHGDVFDYLRNSSLDARNYFDTLDTLNSNGFGTNKSFDYPNKRLPPFHRNNFGGSIGGPIIKDKLFVEAVYEGLRQTWGQTISTNTLPGNCFDQTVGSATYHQVIRSTLLSCAGLNPATAVVNPSVLAALTTPVIPGYVGLFPYPNVNISAAGIKLPGAAGNYTFRFIQPQSESYGQMRVDYTLSAKDTVYARYTQDDSSQVVQSAYAYQRLPEFEGEQFATLGWTHIFTPNLLNKFSSSLSRTNLVGSSTTTAPINPASPSPLTAACRRSPSTGSTSTTSTRLLTTFCGLRENTRSSLASCSIGTEFLTVAISTTGGRSPLARSRMPSREFMAP
jgi:hypothetical protein